MGSYVELSDSLSDNSSFYGSFDFPMQAQIMIN